MSGSELNGRRCRVALVFIGALGTTRYRVTRRLMFHLIGRNVLLLLFELLLLPSAGPSWCPAELASASPAAGDSEAQALV